MKRILTLLLLLASASAFAQKLDTLTVEKIMRDPKWIGVSPSNIRWSDDSKKLYFNWNPSDSVRDGLFSITPGDINPVKVSLKEQRLLPSEYGEWNSKRTLKVYAQNGDVFLEEFRTGKITQLTSTTDREYNPSFTSDGTKVLFMRGDNLYALSLNGGGLTQLTNFVASATENASANAAPRRRGGQGAAKKEQATGNEQETWLKNQQLELFDIIKLQDRDKKLDAIGHVFRESCGDPRKGTLFSIVEGWLAADEKARRETT